MRKLLALMVLGAALSLFGCATTDAPATKADSPKQFIKCSTCGAEFTSRAGIEEHLKSHPGHQADVQPLIKCETCGAEFTSSAGLADHIQANPGHKPAKIEGQYVP